MQAAILALVIVMAFRLALKEKCLRLMAGNEEAFSVWWRDMLAPLPHSVISMSVLYVLTLHHRGDVIDKDGYGTSRQRASVSARHFSDLCLDLSSAPALCSYTPSCVLHISWMPLFTATVTFCPPLCPWYASRSCISAPRFLL